MDRGRLEEYAAALAENPEQEKVKLNGSQLRWCSRQLGGTGEKVKGMSVSELKAHVDKHLRENGYKVDKVFSGELKPEGRDMFDMQNYALRSRIRAKT